MPETVRRLSRPRLGARPSPAAANYRVRFSGPVHDKGFLILAGFLRDRYARDVPLSLKASIVFEQSYRQVEGDSAAAAELLALLSALADRPLRQDLAVTGS
jgi:predicted ATP-dependent protease